MATPLWQQITLMSWRNGHRLTIMMIMWIKYNYHMHRYHIKPNSFLQCLWKESINNLQATSSHVILWMRWKQTCEAAIIGCFWFVLKQKTKVEAERTNLHFFSFPFIVTQFESTACCGQWEPWLVFFKYVHHSLWVKCDLCYKSW